MLDADKTAFNVMRVMVNMNQTGEAAGVACALAIKAGVPLQRLDPEAIRKALMEGGAVVIWRMLQIHALELTALLLRHADSSLRLRRIIRKSGAIQHGIRDKRDARHDRIEVEDAR